jgi:hypothetical protein
MEEYFNGNEEYFNSLASPDRTKPLNHQIARVLANTRRPPDSVMIGVQAPPTFGDYLRADAIVHFFNITAKGE